MTRINWILTICLPKESRTRKMKISFVCFKMHSYLPLHCLEYEPVDHFHIQDLQMTVSWPILFLFSLLPRESRTRKENILELYSQISLSESSNKTSETKGECWETVKKWQKTATALKEKATWEGKKKNKTQYIKTTNGGSKIMFQSIKHFPSAKHPPLTSECLKLKLILARLGKA